MFAEVARPERAPLALSYNNAEMTVLFRLNMSFTPRRGRPRKFTRPSRTITLTLPEDVLTALVGLDPDIGRAIVRLATGLTREERHPGVELATFGRRAVIAVSPTRALSGLRGVELVPFQDGRSLIALDEGMSEAQFELAVRDALTGSTVPAVDRALLEQLALMLQDARRAGTLVLRRLMVVHASGAVRPARRPRKTARNRAADP